MKWTLEGDPKRVVVETRVIAQPHESNHLGDAAASMQHAPVVDVNGHGDEPQSLIVDVNVDEEIILDASAT